MKVQNQWLFNTNIGWLRTISAKDSFALAFPKVYAWLVASM
jgi:hypothetical protein